MHLSQTYLYIETDYTCSNALSSFFIREHTEHIKPFENVFINFLKFLLIIDMYDVRYVHTQRGTCTTYVHTQRGQVRRTYILNVDKPW